MAKQYRNEKLIQAVSKHLRQLREERGLSQEKVTFQKTRKSSQPIGFKKPETK